MRIYAHVLTFWMIFLSSEAFFGSFEPAMRGFKAGASSSSRLQFFWYRSCVFWDLQKTKLVHRHQQDTSQPYNFDSCFSRRAASSSSSDKSPESASSHCLSRVPMSITLSILQNMSTHRVMQRAAARYSSCRSNFDSFFSGLLRVRSRDSSQTYKSLLFFSLIGL